MSNSKILDDLIAAGVPSDTILAVAELIAEAEHTKRIREKTKLRVEKFRERKNAALRNDSVTLHSVTNPGIYTSPTSIEVSKKEEEVYAPAKRKRALPEGYPLSAAASSFASKKGWGSARIQSEFNRFCDHARASGRKQIDWEAAWRNWVTSPFQKPEAMNGNHVRTASDVLREMCQGDGHREGQDTGWLLPEN